MSAMWANDVHTTTSKGKNTEVDNDEEMDVEQMTEAQKSEWEKKELKRKKLDVVKFRYQVSHSSNHSL